MISKGLSHRDPQNNAVEWGFYQDSKSIHCTYYWRYSKIGTVSHRYLTNATRRLDHIVQEQRDEHPICIGSSNIGSNSITMFILHLYYFSLDPEMSALNSPLDKSLN